MDALCRRNNNINGTVTDTVKATVHHQEDPRQRPDPFPTDTADVVVGTDSGHATPHRTSANPTLKAFATVADPVGEDDARTLFSTITAHAR